MNATLVIALLNAIASALTAANPVLSKIVDDISTIVGTGESIDSAMAKVVATLQAGVTESDFTSALAHINTVSQIIANAGIKPETSTNEEQT